MDPHGLGRAGPDDALLEAIEAIYGCVTDPSGFDRLPEALAPVLGARTATVWCMDTDLEPAAVSNYGLTESALQDYLNEWIDNDSLMTAALQSHVGGITTPEGMFGNRGYARLPVFDGFYAPHDIVRQMARFDVLDAGWLGGISFQRGRADPPIDSADRRTLEILAHHLRRAWTITLRTGLLQARAESAETVLASCRLATWLLDGRRHVRASNPAAERLASTPGSGIVGTQGVLRFVDPELEAAFRDALQRIEAGRRTPVELPLAADGPGTLAWGAVIPLDLDHGGNGFVETLYLLVLARPGADADVQWRQLQRRLPISRTEADVLARLMRAEDPPAIAEARGSTLETIRGYEKSLRTKLGCHSRAELVAEGWRTVATIPAVAGSSGQRA